MSVTTELIRITTLVENTAGISGALGEHGLAFWLETASARILFDAGAGVVLEGNANTLGVDLTQADAIVLSHGHYDHTGGLACARRAAPGAKVFCHPAAFSPKYACMMDGTSRYIGAHSTSIEAIRRQEGVMVSTYEPTEIADGLFVTGEIPRVTDFEDTGGPFFLDENCERPDPLIDDQALFFDSPRGTVVILGCAHAGVVNTLRYVRQLTNDKPIHAILGGLHLLWATEERVSQTVEALRALEIEHIGIAHCTGFEASGALLTALPGKCHACIAGSVVEF